MKRVLVICGTGIATSTIVMGKIKEWLIKERINEQVVLHQGKINDAIIRREDYDLIVSTTIVPEDMKDEVVNAVPLLTGIDVDEVYSLIKDRIV